MNNHLSEEELPATHRPGAKAFHSDREPGGAKFLGGNVLDVLENLQVEGHRRSMRGEVRLHVGFSPGCTFGVFLHVH